MPPNFPSPVRYHANKTCPVAGHELFTSLLTLHTPFLISCRSLLSPKHVIWSTHSNISCRECYQGMFLYETFMIWVTHDTSHSKLTPQMKTMHMCSPLSTHNIYSKVAIVTILWLLAVIRISLKITQKLCYQRILFLRHSWYELLMTRVIQTLTPKTIHKWFPLSTDNIYIEVAMVTILAT